jgi:hypothetical protein
VVERLVENAPVALRGAIEPAHAVMLERHVRAICFWIEAVWRERRQFLAEKQKPSQAGPMNNPFFSHAESWGRRFGGCFATTRAREKILSRKSRVTH